MPLHTNRRDFVKTSAAIGAGLWVGTGVAATPRSPLERLNVASVGVGGKGSGDCSNSAKQGGNIVGICDIDERRLSAKSREFLAAEKFVDYREMLTKLGDKVDIVTVSTPDHSHAPAAIMAMKLGKNVYCQKPLTWSIYEARRMREVAAETGVVTQMGNQGTSLDGLRTAVEIVQDGGIGDVTDVHIWTNRPVWPQGKGRPEGQDKIPSYLHWDLFLGPAPDRPYVGNKTYQPFNWRGWLDYGTGALGDMACHTANMAVMAAYLFEPASFEAEKNTGIVDNEQFPAASRIRFDFPEREGKGGTTLPACTVYWYDGGELPGEDILPNSVLPEEFRSKVEAMGRKKAMSSGSLIIGSKGMIFSPNDYGAQIHLLPEAKFVDYKKPEPWLPRVPKGEGGFDRAHMGEFMRACAGEGKTMSHFGYAGRLTETILCGNLALKVPGKIVWDAGNLMAVNSPEANMYVHRKYREGWSI